MDHRIMIGSCNSSMSEKHDFLDWRPEFFQGRMVLDAAGSKQVVRIDNEGVTDRKRRTHFICGVKECCQLPDPDVKDLAIRTIVKSEAQKWLVLSGNSDKRVCVGVLDPDTKQPFRLMIHNHSEGKVCYNRDHQVIKPRKYVNEINTQWECIPSRKKRPADLCCTSLLAAAPLDLAKPGRLEDVRSIDTVVDYVAGGEHHPLVIFDVDDTMITRDILINGTTGHVPMAKNTAEIVAKIRQKSPGSEIILLTQASKKMTLVKLREAGISPELFNSIESVADNGGDKGIALKAYVRKMRQKPDQVCFIDDCDHFLSLVEKASKDLRIHCNTFHFTGANDAVARVKANALGCTVEEYKRRFQPRKS